jgi:hypothetical protein
MVASSAVQGHMAVDQVDTTYSQTAHRLSDLVSNPRVHAEISNNSHCVQELLPSMNVCPARLEHFGLAPVCHVC